LDTIYTSNEVFKNEVPWLSKQNLLNSQLCFEELCRLSALVGAIDRTHVVIKELKREPKDYFTLGVTITISIFHL